MLKIDRSFIGRMANGDENSEIVRTICRLANNLGMEVVAEGVESREQLELLRSLKCEYGQGYFFSKPVEAESATELVLANPSCYVVVDELMALDPLRRSSGKAQIFGGLESRGVSTFLPAFLPYLPMLYLLSVVGYLKKSPALHKCKSRNV